MIVGMAVLVMVISIEERTITIIIAAVTYRRSLRSPADCTPATVPALCGSAATVIDPPSTPISTAHLELNADACCRPNDSAGERSMVGAIVQGRGCELRVVPLTIRRAGR